MKKYFFALFLTIAIFSNSLNAQTYKLTHFQLTANSVPRTYDGPLIILSDTFLTNISEVKNGDTTEVTVTKELILKNKKGRYVKTQIANGANNYYFELSDIKAEKKAGIYDITVEAAYNNGTVKTLFFKGKRIDQGEVKK